MKEKKEVDMFVMFMFGLIVGLVIAALIAEACEHQQRKNLYEQSEF